MSNVFTRLRAFLASILLPARAWTGAAWGVGLTAVLLWGALAWAGLAPADGLTVALFWLSGLAFGALFGGLMLLIGWLLRRLPPRYGWARSPCWRRRIWLCPSPMACWRCSAG